MPVKECDSEKMVDEQEQPTLRRGLLLWDPTEGGSLYTVTGFTGGQNQKAVLIHANPSFSNELTLKTKLLPKGWSILSTQSVESLIADNPSRVGI